MPEGHTVHGHARRHLKTFSGRRLAVDSPQGRFAAGASLLDGRVLAGAQAHGKHLFLGFCDEAAARPQTWLHVHLGLYGGWRFGTGPAPQPRGAVRVRFRSLPPVVADAAAGVRSEEAAWAELRGPTTCEVLRPPEVTAVRARLGADPLRRDGDLAATAAHVARRRTPIAALLMQQDVVSGVGNVFRAEALYRARLDPYLPGRDLPDGAWDALWADLVVLLRDGLRRGRIVTTRPEHRRRARGAVPSEEAHYVYRRAGLPCRLCGTPVVVEPLAGRRLYYCPSCQRGQQ